MTDIPEDEDLLNVGIWEEGGTKLWCKLDQVCFANSRQSFLRHRHRRQQFWLQIVQSIYTIAFTVVNIAFFSCYDAGGY